MSTSIDPTHFITSSSSANTPPPPLPPSSSKKLPPPPSKGDSSKQFSPIPRPSSSSSSKSRSREIYGSKRDSIFSVASKISEPKVHLVDRHRALKCEDMLRKIKIPLPDISNAILALDSSALDIDQVEKLIQFCPTKEEMEMLKNYSGDKGMLGKCEQFFLELLKVPHVESKLRLFTFVLDFSSRVKALKLDLNIVTLAAREIKESEKLRQIMRTILALGYPFNRDSAARPLRRLTLDSLLGGSYRDTNSSIKMALLHHLCKILTQRMPELLDFRKDLAHLEPASKILTKDLAEEMYLIMKGLEKVKDILIASENDGSISSGFHKVTKSFLDAAESEKRLLNTLYIEAGRAADSLISYFLNDPQKYHFEQVIHTFVIFTKLLTNEDAYDEKQQYTRTEKTKLQKAFN